MKSIPVEEFVKIADFWVNQTWPLSLEGAESSALELGWEQVGRGLFDMPYPLVDRTVTFSEGGESMVAMINFATTDVVLEESVDRDMFMNDFFAAAVGAFERAWQKPMLKKRKESHLARWELSNGCEINLSNHWSMINFVLFSPDYAEVERYLRGRR